MPTSLREANRQIFTVHIWLQPNQSQVSSDGVSPPKDRIFSLSGMIAPFENFDLGLFVMPPPVKLLPAP
jgi:hypothetical protein